MLASSCFSEDAALLDLLVEAPQGSFECFVLADSDFCQLGNHLPPVSIWASMSAGTGTDDYGRCGLGELSAPRPDDVPDPHQRQPGV